MMKRPHCCALMIGVALLIAAVLLALRVERSLDDFAAPAPQMADVVTAVNQLEGGCLTCHTTLTQTDTLSHPAVDRPVAPIRAREMTLTHAATEPPVQAVIDARLHDLGQRILIYADQPDRVTAEAVQTYLHTYRATRNLSPSPDASTLHRIELDLAAVEALLLEVENAVNPVRLAANDGPPKGDASLAAPVPPGVTSVAFWQAGITLDTSPGQARMAAAPHQLTMSFEVVYAVLRRGPPAPDSIDSVWSKRLLVPLSGEQSLFVWPDSRFSGANPTTT